MKITRETPEAEIITAIYEVKPPEWEDIYVEYKKGKDSWEFQVFCNYSEHYEFVPVDKTKTTANRVRLDWELNADSDWTTEFIVDLMKKQIEVDLDSGDILGYESVTPR